MVAREEFIIQGYLGQAMPSPILETWLHQHGLYAGDFCLIKDLNIVTPVNVEDGVETVLMEALKEL